MSQRISKIAMKLEFWLTILNFKNAYLWMVMDQNASLVLFRLELKI